MRPFQFQVMNELVPTNMDEKTFVTLDNDHFLSFVKYVKVHRPLEQEQGKMCDVCLTLTFNYPCLHVCIYFPTGLVAI